MPNREIKDWDKRGKLIEWTYTYSDPEKREEEVAKYQQVVKDETTILSTKKDEASGSVYHYVAMIKKKKITCPTCGDVRHIRHQYDGPDSYDGIVEAEYRFDEITMGGLCPDCVRELEDIRKEESKYPKWHDYGDLLPL